MRASILSEWDWCCRGALCAAHRYITQWTLWAYATLPVMVRPRGRTVRLWMTHPPYTRTVRMIFELNRGSCRLQRATRRTQHVKRTLFQNSNATLSTYFHTTFNESVVPHLLSRILLLLLLLRLRRGLSLGPRHLGQDGRHLLPLVKRLPQVVQGQDVLADLLKNNKIKGVK